MQRHDVLSAQPRQLDATTVIWDDYLQKLEQHLSSMTWHWQYLKHTDSKKATVQTLKAPTCDNTEVFIDVFGDLAQNPVVFRATLHRAMTDD